MQSLKTKIDSNVQTAEQDVRGQLDSVKKRIDQNRATVTTARADIKKWVDERKASAQEKIAEWKSKRDMSKLQSRAESAERYAAATAFMALAAIDEAEEASLEAWLAGKDADVARATRAA